MTLCRDCKGTGQKFKLVNRKLTWKTCKRCSGKGTKFIFGPKTITCHEPSISGKWVEFSINDFEPNTKMSFVLAKAGFFKSISEANRQGWNKEIQSGIFKIGKNKLVLT